MSDRRSDKLMHIANQREGCVEKLEAAKQSGDEEQIEKCQFDLDQLEEARNKEMGYGKKNCSFQKSV